MPKRCVFRRRKSPKNINLRPLISPKRFTNVLGALKCQKGAFFGAENRQKVREILYQEKKEKLLGCQIQADLKWHQQVKELKSKLKKRLVGLNHIKFVLPFPTRRTVSDGMFNSVLVYCLPLFGGGTAQELKELQVLQNKAARIVTHSPRRAGRQGMFDQLDWLSVRQLVVYHSLLSVYRIRSSQEPEYLASRLSRDNHFGKIILPKTNLSLYRNSFGYRAARDWNLLPQRLRQLGTISVFKKELRTWVKREIPRFSE